MNQTLVSICAILFLPCFAHSQSDSLAARSDASMTHPWRVAVVAVGYAGLVTTAHLQSYNSWWRGERTAFHFSDDTTKTLGADKLGHLYFTYLASDILGRSLIWAGLEPHEAFLYGGALSLAFQLYVEIEDAFHPHLGFSVGDAAADVLGAAYPWLQEVHRPLGNLRFKWSFIRSERFKRGAHRIVVDDYESQYYWLSANVKELFSEIIPSFWPSFLAIAVGYGVKDLYGAGEQEIYLAFDYDFERLPGEGSFLSALKHVLNYFHFPAPTIRLTPSVITFGLRF